MHNPFLFGLLGLNKINFKVHNFWPPRSKPKGFSIETLARKYRQKLSSVSYEAVATSSQNDNLEEVISPLKHIQEINIDPKTRSMHWANRDFSEYREVA